MLGLACGGAGDWTALWSTALKSGVVHDWGCSRQLWGAGLCSALELTPRSVMTPPGEAQMCLLGVFQPFPVPFPTRML